MTATLNKPLVPFVDELPVPRRLVAAEHHGRLIVRMRPGTHRFHRDLPESRVWGYDGTVPGPTVEAERGRRGRRAEAQPRRIRKATVAGFDRLPSALTAVSVAL